MSDFDIDDVKRALEKSVFDIMEAVAFSQILINRDVWQIGGADLSHDWRAYSIAAIISYSRPFKKSYGLPQTHRHLNIEYDNFNSSLHEELLRRRDKIIAHGDSEHFSIFDKYQSGNGMSLSTGHMYLSETEARGLIQLGTHTVSHIETMRTNQEKIFDLYTQMTKERGAA